MNHMYQIWLTHPYYGYRRVTAALTQEGYEINTKRVRRLMNDMNIQALYPKPKLSRNRIPHHRYPYVVDRQNILKPDQVWGTDITYIKMPRGFVYLVALIDWFSRYVVAYSTSITLDSEGCVDMLKSALANATPMIVNSDQGTQFTSDDWINTLKDAKVTISMNGKGRCTDNAITERLWRSIKQESVYLSPPDTVAELNEQLAQYMLYYNHKRPHQSLGYKTPAEYYKGRT